MQKASLALIALLVTACTDPGPQRDQIATGPPSVEIKAYDPAHPGTSLDDGQTVPIDTSAAVCACLTADCIHAWFADNFGCGVCFDLVCDDGQRLGGCVPCDKPQGALSYGERLP